MVNGTHWAKPFFVLNLENVLSGNSNEHKSAVYHVYVIILFNIVLSHYIYYCAFLRTSLFFQEKKGIQTKWRLNYQKLYLLQWPLEARSKSKSISVDFSVKSTNLTALKSMFTLSPFITSLHRVILFLWIEEF